MKDYKIIGVKLKNICKLIDYLYIKNGMGEIIKEL